MRVGLSSLVVVFAPMAAGPAFAENLTDALRAANASNPTLEAARSDTKAIAQDVAIARGAFLPNIVFGGTINRNVNENAGVNTQIGVPIPIESTVRTRSFGLDASLNQDIFTSGRNLGQLGQAKARARAALANLVGVEQQVALQVVTAYVDVRRDLEALRISVNNQEVLVQRLEEARQRFAVGDVTRTDVAQAEASLAGARAAVATAQANLDASRAIYREVVGAAPGELEAPPDVAAVLPGSLEAALATAEDLSPTITRAEYNLRGAKHAVTVARSGYLPQLGVTGQINRFNTDGDAIISQFDGNGDFIGSVRNPSDSLRRGTTVAGRLTVPLYDGGIARAQTRAAKAQATSAKARLEETRRDVFQQAAAAWANYQASQSVIVSSREQVQANLLALEGVEQEQKVGLRTTIDVLIAQQTLLDSQLALVNAERNAYVAAHTLLAVIGVLNAQTLGLADQGAYSPAAQGEPQEGGGAEQANLASQQTFKLSALSRGARLYVTRTTGQRVYGPFLDSRSG